eukprot:CCRYP_005341-RD/>CCRYP_005341-RD protein AED:0.37 eAED:0.37 QI:0/0/0/1/0/0/5/0/743
MIHEPHSTEEATQHAVHILDAKYEKADLQSVVDNNCPHLSLQDQNKLLELLRKYKDLFDGTLGDWNTEPVSFKLKEGAKPYHGRAYPVPHSVKETLMKELKRLCDLGVLQWQPASEWASPSFIVPKEDQTEHFLSDFREVNKRVVRKPFSLPKISTFMQELEGFTFATPLDLNMGYYTIRLDPDASKICIIIFPWDFEIYTDASSKQLGAVITQNNRSIAFFSRKLFVCQQTYSVTKIELLAIVETLKEFKGMLWGHLVEAYKPQLVENVQVLCKDGKLVIPQELQQQAVKEGLRTTVQSHVKKCHSCQVNKRRQTKYGKLPTKLAITNPWEALCVDFIGPYTLKGKDKTQIDFMCITMIDPATSWFEIVELPVSQLQKLDIPMGTKGQRSKDAHVQEQQPYFDKTSATVGNLVNRTWFSRYPRSQYVIYSNGSEFKLHFETLCESYGLKRKPTSVKNPQANAILERVHQTIMAMLRTAKLDMADTISESDIADFLTNAAWAVRSTYHTVLTTSPGAAIFGRDMLFDVPYIADWTKIGEYRQRQTDPEEDPSPVQHSDLMNFVFANRSEQNAIYPLTVREIAAAQHTDKTLDKLSLLEAYKPQLVENVQVLCKDGKLVVPQELQQRAVRWYHHYLQHPGTTRLTEALRAVMYWKGLRHSVGTFVKNCHKCQVNKRRQRKYGKLPTKLVVSNPWEVLCVDLIGSYTLKGKDGTEIDFMCVTMIDPATSWFKIVELPVTVCYSQG